MSPRDISVALVITYVRHIAVSTSPDEDIVANDERTNVR
jgi:hypothetical protein